MNPTKALDQFYNHMWTDYCHLNPQAKAVFEALSKAGEKVVNDHIAFRTWSHPKVRIEKLAQHFTKYDYHKASEYKFDEKKLRAQHFEHLDPSYPKVFISELDLSQFSQATQNTFENIAHQVNEHSLHHESFLYSGRLWNADYKTYLKLAEESDYAAWLYAHGFRPNHFTVYINFLKKLNTIESLNQFLKDQGFKLNTFGGEIKGTPQVFLEQSSTMANEIIVQFSDGAHRIPGCYYEFAKRYPMENGQIFQGFIGKSADKIFESTHRTP